MLFQPEEKVPLGVERVEGDGDGDKIYDSEVRNKKIRTHIEF